MPLLFIAKSGFRQFISKYYSGSLYQRVVSKMEQESEEINTLVCFDIETTGLPGQEWGRTRITELSLCAARTCDLRRISNGGLPRLPRVINKINLCLNPNKPICKETSDITGLDNDLLEYYGGFDEKIYHILENFFLRLPKPICLLSHNGNKFDYPILASELRAIKKTLPMDILCADSLNCYRQIYGVNKARKNLFPAGYNGNGSKLHMNVQINGIQKIPSKSSSGPGAAADITPTTSMESLLSDEWDLQLVELAEQVEQPYLATTPPNQRIPEPVMPPTPRYDRFRSMTMQERNESTPSTQMIGEGERPRSFKLVDIYTHLTECRAPPNLHSAEADSLALMQCVACSTPQVFPWLQENAVPFAKFYK
ncbi:hypothetical protein B566_EDAN006630 [Ephemera danica]|nr:hypothetical protein B566_EDAN006630 [Ephemera danica]